MSRAKASVVHHPPQEPDVGQARQPAMGKYRRREAIILGRGLQRDRVLLLGKHPFEELTRLVVERLELRTRLGHEVTGTSSSLTMA